MISRDSNFYSDIEREQRDFRNSHFNKLSPTIEDLIQRGYWVVRMGRQHLDDNVHFHSDRFIDYGNFKDADDVIDIMMIRECEFFVAAKDPRGNYCRKYLED